MDPYIALAGEALWLILMLSLPALLASLVVGVFISLLQALTQVQEQTLTFVPKIIATILVLILTAHSVLDRLLAFSHKVFAVMLQVGGGS
ncbi:MAG TPA: flagellar biosynthetic protein FliQ [Pyrinomonadaceae bacterium]|jgi:flagellar biosynthetic protein FliQ|nr:flagellar biosynthetic protein FliQ [Pyrinomonadaceae bacterium]